MPIQKPFAVLPLTLTGIASGNEKANRPASHLGLPYPGMRWESTGASNVWARGQFGGASQAVSFMSLMAANAQSGTTIRLRLGTSQAAVDGSAPYDSGALPLISPARTRADGLYHSHLELPSVVNASWWRIDIGGHSGDFSAANLVLGEKRTAARFYNRDRERGYQDLGSLEFSRNGVHADTPGVVLKTLSFRMEWASEDEWENVWSPLFSTKGKRQPVFIALDPESTTKRQEKVFYGYLAQDLFIRGGAAPDINQVDIQLRAVL